MATINANKSKIAWYYDGSLSSLKGLEDFTPI